MLTQKFRNEVTETRFSQKRRLSNPNEFKAVFQVAKKLYTRNFALHVKKNDLNYPRLGIIVAKRNVRQAVTRNLIKRMIRESFRLNQVSLCGADVIVVVYSAFSVLSRQEMRKALDEQWKKAVIASTGCARQSTKNSDSLEQPKS